MLTKIIQTLNEFKAPLLATLFAMTGMGFFTTFITLYLTNQGYDLSQIGQIHSAYFAGLLLGAWKIQSVIKKVGHAQSLAAFGGLGVAVILIQGIFPDFVVWMGTRFLSGVSLSAIYVVIEGWMLEKADQDQRGTALSLYMIALMAGYGLGQQGLHFIEVSSLKPFLLAALFTSLSIIPVSLSPKKIHIGDYEEFLRFDKLWFISPFGCAACMMSGLLTSASYAFLPLYGIEIGLTLGSAVFLFVLGSIFLQWPLGKLSDSFDRRKVLFFTGLLLFLPASFLFFEMAPSLNAFYAGLFIYGGICYSIYPIGMTQVCDHLGEGSLTQAASSLLIFYSVGSVLGPVFASQAINVMGGKGLFLYVMLLIIPFTLVGLAVLYKKDPIPEEEQRDLIAVPQTTPAVNELNLILEEDESSN